MFEWIIVVRMSTLKFNFECCHTILIYCQQQLFEQVLVSLWKFRIFTILPQLTNSTILGVIDSNICPFYNVWMYLNVLKYVGTWLKDLFGFSNYYFLKKYLYNSTWKYLICLLLIINHTKTELEKDNMENVVLWRLLQHGCRVLEPCSRSCGFKVRKCQLNYPNLPYICGFQVHLIQSSLVVVLL